MHDWNVVATAYEHRFKHACELLQALGPVSRTAFFNVLVMKVDDTEAFLEQLRAWRERDPEVTQSIARVVPASRVFGFQSPEEFETKVKEAVKPWVTALAGKRFHVRMHRRGFKSRLSSQYEERFLDHFLLDALEEAGTPGTITFDDPDAIIAVETLGQRAGVSLWTREALKRYPFLHLD